MLRHRPICGCDSDCPPYGYFLSQFASGEGKKAGELYTPRCVVRLLVEMLELVAASITRAPTVWHVRAVGRVHPRARQRHRNGDRAKGDISIYGQESNYTTWRPAKMI
jgi:type I restriction enzyme M protein